MVVSVLIFAYRKPGLSLEEFRHHWETKHVPLIKSLTGSHFPLSHTRRYVHRTHGSGGGPANPTLPATLFAGEQDQVDYDGIAELTFEDQDAFGAFHAAVSAPEAAARIAEDEDCFGDRSRTVIVMLGETTSTTRDQAAP